MAEQMPFHSTPIGRKYYEETLPNLIKSLNKLAGALQKREIKSGIAPIKSMALLKGAGKYRFPLFTGWFFYLLNYKLAYEFVKKKGLFKEFQMWSEDEGRELAKTFFKEGLEMLEEQEQRDHEATNDKDLIRNCQWMGCKNIGKLVPISFLGGAALNVWLCEKHEEIVRRPPVSMEQKLVKAIEKDEKKKKDDELGRITKEMGRIDVEIADLAQKLAIKKNIRAILENKSRILAREISDN